MDKVFAIVVTYNGEFWIRKCLSSLRNSTIPVNIIVLDNKSTDKTIDIIENEFPFVQLIKSEKNLGFGQGNNIGLRIALKENASYVFLLNQDAWIEKDSIKKLIEVHQKFPEFGIISPIHLNAKNEIEYFFSTCLCPENTQFYLSDLYFRNQKVIYETKFVNAAAWLISNNCLKIVGLFDPIFSHYGEDNDYLRRAQFHHFKVGICSNSIIYHDAGYDMDSIMKSIHRTVISHILALRNINASFKSNLLVFLKTELDNISSKIIYRRFGELKIRFIAFVKALKLLRKISKSYKIVKKDGAYLER